MHLHKVKPQEPNSMLMLIKNPKFPIALYGTTISTDSHIEKRLATKVLTFQEHICRLTASEQRKLHIIE